MKNRPKKPASEEQIRAFRKAVHELGENEQQLRESLRDMATKRKPPPDKDDETSSV
jgi:hypothetical protein